MNSRKAALKSKAQSSREYYKRNRQKCIDKVKKWQSENPDKVRKNAQKFRKKNPNYKRDLAARKNIIICEQPEPVIKHTEDIEEISLSRRKKRLDKKYNAKVRELRALEKEIENGRV